MIDSFLIWRLTGGRMHFTDATNASRTSLYNIHDNDWDDDLLALFDVPRSGLQVMDCAANSVSASHFSMLIPSAAVPATSRRRPSARAVLPPAR